MGDQKADKKFDTAVLTFISLISHLCLGIYLCSSCPLALEYYSLSSSDRGYLLITQISVSVSSPQEALP